MNEVENANYPSPDEAALSDDKVKLTTELLAELVRARKRLQVRYVEAKGECETCGTTLPFNPREGGIRRYCGKECKQNRHNARGPRKVRRLRAGLEKAANEMICARPGIGGQQCLD